MIIIHEESDKSISIYATSDAEFDEAAQLHPTAYRISREAMALTLRQARTHFATTGLKAIERSLDIHDALRRLESETKQYN